MTDHEPVLYATRVEVSEIRQQAREDARRVNETLCSLLEQNARSSILQERLIKAIEDTNVNVSSLAKNVTQLREEKIRYEAQIDLIKKTFSMGGGIKGVFKIIVAVFMLGMVVEGGADFMHWAKLGIKHLGIG